MPEGPEVETVRRSLEGRVVGAELGRAWVSRFSLRTTVTSRSLAFLNERRVSALCRKGKTLVLDVDGDVGVFVRLGMTGRLLLMPVDAPLVPHTHVRLPLRGTSGANGTGTRELRFVDPRRFGEFTPFLSRAVRDEELARLGPDGLSLTTRDRAVVAAALQKTQRTIKDALLDQRVVAGVGNIYAAEACFVARVSPLRCGSSLTDHEVERLVTAVESVLAQAVMNRGTSFSDYVDGDGQAGLHAASLWVFQREGEPCRVCGTAVQRIIQGARSTFLCSRCQRPFEGRRRR